MERTTMRFLTLPTLTILAGGLLAAADSTTVTYIDGNVAELSPSTSATLYTSNPLTLELKTPLHKVQIPYAQISKAQVGSVMVHTPEPLYKVWALPKRLVKSETQQMTLAFTDGNGLAQTMTLEMPKASADSVLA